MRKISELSVQAFLSGTPFKNGNMKVFGNKENTLLTLHDNVIASKQDNRLILTDSGWQTVTTKERLNAVLNAIGSEWRIYQLAGVWYITDGCGKRENWNGTMEVTL